MPITDPYLSTLQSSDFSEFFDTDFNYTVVTDAKIQNAYLEANYQINPALFVDNDDLRLAFLYLAAHCLVLKLRASNVGQNSVGENVMSGSGVGGVSISYALPERFAKNPQFAQYNLTHYGQKYFTMLHPRLVGNVSAVMGGTLP